MASAVFTSCGKAGFNADAQCTQLLSQAKVHRQGIIYKGPFSFKKSFSDSLAMIYSRPLFPYLTFTLPRRAEMKQSRANPHTGIDEVTLAGKYVGLFFE